MNQSPQARTVAQPYRWPLVQQPNNRSESVLKDARMVNCIAEKDPETGEWQVQKRVGYTSTGGFTAANGTIGRGMYTWNSGVSTGGQLQPSNFAVFGTGSNAYLYRDGVQQGLALADSNGNWSWTETQGATRYVVFASPYSSNVYYTSGGAATAAGLPAGRGAYVVGLAYLDGTIYFMDEKCNIYGSGIDDPTTWSTTNLIVARSVPGWGVGLAKQLNYVIALKTNSMEVFEDAGNATGSPLTQLQGATNGFGCANHDTLQMVDDTLFYASSNQTASPQIVRVDNLVPSIVSTPAIERMLDTSMSNSFYSFAFKHGGHRFYAITFATAGTFVYDIDQNLWYQWTDTNGSSFPMASAGIKFNFNHLFQHQTNGKVYVFEGDYTYPTDDGVVAPVDIYTPSTDFGTRRKKTLHRMYIRSDQTPGSTLYVRRSDDDFQTWSNPRKVDLGQKTPYLDREGSFVKRAYHFRHSAPTALRIRSADLQMDFGTV